jgi:predicted small lipoprotein YifL
MKYVTSFFVLLFLFTLTACGSGSADSDSDNGEAELPPIDSYTPSTVPPERKEAFEQYLKMQHVEQMFAISGLFRVEIGDDLSYYFIPPYVGSNGYTDYYVTAFNYLGDAHDNSSNCYLPAREGDRNLFLNTGTGADKIGAMIVYKNQFESVSGNAEFSIPTPAGDIVFEVNPLDDKLQKVSFAGVSSSTGSLVDDANKVAISSVKETGVHIDTIMANQCKGLPAVYAPSGFSGVYDTSTTINNMPIENYLYIDEIGELHNWKYKGDGFGPNDNQNCYMRGDWYNQELNGEKLMYNKERNYLFVNVNQHDLRWYLDDNGQIISVGAPEPLMSVTVPLLDVTMTTKKAHLTIEDLEALECK